MTVIAEFTMAASDFPLGRVFEDRPRVTLELDRVVPSGDTVMPYFWVHDPEGDLHGVLAVFDELPELRSAVLMEDLGERGLFRAEWEPRYLGIMRAIEATGVTVVSATGSEAGWMFELRAADGVQFSQFQEYCEEHGIVVSLTRLSRLTETGKPAEDDFTPEQREALLLAYREGYFEEPKATDQETLASRLDISRQALSARLRRGYRNLIEGTLLLEHHDRP